MSEDTHLGPWQSDWERLSCLGPYLSLSPACMVLAGCRLGVTCQEERGAGNLMPRYGMVSPVVEGQDVSQPAEPREGIALTPCADLVERP